jgi:hypothetical protein
MTTAREQTLRLADLLRREHHALAEFLVALAAFDEAKGWVELEYSSLFYFLLRELGLPKGPVHSTGRRNTESDTGGAHEPDSFQVSMDERIRAH